MSGIFDSLFTVLFYVMVCIIMVVGVTVTYPRYLKARALDITLSQVEAQISMKEHELSFVREKQHRFATDPEFVESIARKNRRVFPGELVFIFDE